MDPAPIRRTEGQHPGARGDALFQRAWLPERPERALLLVHGLGEHSGRYEHVGAWFAARGCAVTAYDHIGHGRSPGPRGHCRRFDDLLDDLAAVLAEVRRLHPDLPVFPVGHSMGGLVVSAFLRERRPEVAGAVTSGAALQAGPNASAALRWIARLLAPVAPRLRLATQIVPDDLSRDPAVGAAYVADPLVLDRITLSLANQLFGAIQRTGGGGADVEVPLLMLHGEADPICPVAGTRTFFDAVAAPGRALVTYPELRHEIFNEPERERVFEDVHAWLRGREG